jgi:hypothetical protein
VNHIVSMYVVCSEEEAPGITERLNRIVTGFGLDGYETGMTMQVQDDDEDEDDDDAEVPLVPFEADDT